MRAAFLLVASKAHRRRSQEVAALIANPSVGALQFTPTDHLQWGNDTGSVVLGAWEERPPEARDASRWSVGVDGVALSVGFHREPGRRGAPERTWAAALAAGGAEGLRRRELVGVYTALVVGRDGIGTVAIDPLGFSTCFVGEDDDVVALSSHAGLAALAVASGAVAKDPMASCWPAFAGYWLGTRTGYERVRVLRPDEVVSIDPGGVRVERQSPAWEPPAELRSTRASELVARARAEIVDTLHAALALDEEVHELDLTGGRDSRLLLALLVSEGLTDRFTFRTVGPPGLADVRIATELASRFGLDHRVEFIGMRPPGSFADGVRAFVPLTGGMVNISERRVPRDPSGRARVTGLCGEMLRAHRPPTFSSADLAAYPEAARFGSLGLVRRDAADELHALALVELGVGDDRLTPAERLDAFYFNETRFTRLGPVSTFDGDPHVVPLYAIEAIRAAFALGDEERHRQRIHREVIGDASEALVRLELAGTPWPGGDVVPEIVPPLPAPHRPVPQPAPAPGAAVPPPNEPLMAGLHRRAFPQRKAALAEVLAEAANPAWAVIDRERASAALDRFDSLAFPERRQLFGAVTTALWLGG